MGRELTEAVLEDPSTAPIDDRLRATLKFLRKMTLCPDELGPADAQRVRDAGVSDAALTDAIQVCALFNMIDRIADAVGFFVPTPEQFARDAPGMLRRGYQL